MSRTSVPVLRPPAEITESSLDLLQEVLAPYLDAPGPGIVLDLEEVLFINSSGLGMLVQIGMRLDGAGRRLAFARPTKAIERMLRLVGLDAKMPLFRTIDEATVSLRSRTAAGGR